jgi:hypothetical protein
MAHTNVRDHVCSTHLYLTRRHCLSGAYLDELSGHSWALHRGMGEKHFSNLLVIIALPVTRAVATWGNNRGRTNTQYYLEKTPVSNRD